MAIDTDLRSGVETSPHETGENTKFVNGRF
jgi:hypothetical protein